ncbi:MAG: sodium:proton antiporter, partial [Alistipes sp.]|nr:sodium:proton antiporter [Alistipes sp.]
MLAALTRTFMKFAKRTLSIVISTIATGLFCNITTADQYISIIITGNTFGDLYRRRGLEGRLLSRSVEDSATVTSVLIPWNSCGMTQSTVLGVATVTYLPYCLFNIISPLLSILVAATGYKIVKREATDE